VEIAGIYGRNVNNETGQNSDGFAGFMRQMAANNPGDDFMADMANRLANQPMYSPTVQAMLFGSPTAQELANLGVGRGSAGGRSRGRGRGRM